ARTIIATTARRAAEITTVTVAMRDPPRDFPTGNSVTRNLMRRGTGVVRSDPTHRVAKGFARMVTVRSGIGRPEIARTARDRRVMATVPVAIGPRENLAATRSSRVVRQIVAARARILATVLN